MKLHTTLGSKQREVGDMFKEVTGHAVTDSMSVQDVERVVEKKMGHKLEFKYFNSNVVPRRGDVFPHTHVDMDKVNQEIDRYLQKT